MDWDERKKQIKQEKAKNLQAAVVTFEEAAELATANGWVLIKKTDYHYQLKNYQYVWLYNLYPSNQRIWNDPTYKGPFLHVPKPWTFKDVVIEAIQKTFQGRNVNGIPGTKTERKA